MENYSITHKHYSPSGTLQLNSVQNKGKKSFHIPLRKTDKMDCEVNDADALGCSAHDCG